MLPHHMHLDANIPHFDPTERLSAELMGHAIRRERYGDGPDLELLQKALVPISY